MESLKPTFPFLQNSRSHLALFLLTTKITFCELLVNGPFVLSSLTWSPLSFYLGVSGLVKTIIVKDPGDFLSFTTFPFVLVERPCRNQRRHP